MGKLRLFILLTTSAILFITRYGNGQNRISFVDNSVPGTNHYLSINELSTRAVRNFKHEFPKVENESWVRIFDDYTANFTEAGIQWFVRYDRKGYRSCTVKLYHEKQLPIGIRELVRKKYSNYAVTLVEEETIKELTYYIIHIANAARFKRLYFADGSLTVIEEREKPQVLIDTIYIAAKIK